MLKRESLMVLVIVFVLATGTQQILAQSVEPLAGTWKTWVRTSGSQLRLPLPPSDLFATETAELRMLESQRGSAALDLINFWDAGSPGFRWIEMLYPPLQSPLERNVH